MTLYLALLGGFFICDCYCYSIDLENHTRHTYYVLNGLKETTLGVNYSFSTMNMSINSTLMYLVKKAEELDIRMDVLESHPREVLIKQINSIHKEVYQCRLYCRYGDPLPTWKWRLIPTLGLWILM